MIDYKLVTKSWIRLAAWVMPLLGLALFIHGTVDKSPIAQFEVIVGIFTACVGLLVAPTMGRVVLEENDGTIVMRLGFRTFRYDVKDLREVSETADGFSIMGKNGVQLQFIPKSLAMKRA